MFDNIKKYFKKHWLAWMLAFFVALVYVGPQLYFIATNYDIYQGIPLMENSNQDFYIARIQEIIDGHLLVGSPAFFEYKDQVPTQPPSSELLFALPTLLLNIPVAVTLMASKFILPFLLFLLVYTLIYNLLGKDNSWPKKITAIAGAVFITLGYDLVDYRTTIDFILGKLEPTTCLLWSRPMNPGMGAIYLFSFLLIIWTIVQKTKYLKSAIVGASFFLALMFTSYFFSWGLAISIIAFLGLFYLLKKDFKAVKYFIYIVVLGILFSFPYWYLSWQAKKSIYYEESLLRSGMFYTHYPLFNKLLLAVIIVYIPILIFKFYKKIKLKNSDLFIWAFLLGGLWAYNQQVITGITVWPFHFVQYTIPLSIIVLMIFLYNVIYKHFKKFFILLIIVTLVSSVWIGIYTQYKNYIFNLERSRSDQLYADISEFFNSQEKDCVVLVSAEKYKFIEISGMILSYTHCNVYMNTWVYSIMPQDRIYHNYLVNLRFLGISSDEIDQAVNDPASSTQIYLFSNWAGLYDETRFPDFTDPILAERIKQVPNDYREFLNNDLKSELDKYRLDFIMSNGPLSQDIQSQLDNIEFVKQFNNLYIYKYFQDR